MSTELAKLGLNLPVAPNVSDETFEDLAKATDYDPRLQLCGASCDLCKEGKIGIGRFAIVKRKNDLTDLGPNVDVAVLSLRLKAMQIAGDKVLNYYDHTLPEFLRIRSQSTIADSGCLCGPEFYVYVPAAKTFATFFMNSKTLKGEAPKVRTYLGKFATLKSELITTKKYKWHGARIYPCSLDLELPNVEKIQEKVNRFVNEKSSQVEAIEGTEQVRDR